MHDLRFSFLQITYSYILHFSIVLFLLLFIGVLYTFETNYLMVISMANTYSCGLSFYSVYQSL